MNEINIDDNDRSMIAPEFLLYQTISEYGKDPGDWIQRFGYIFMKILWKAQRKLDM